MAKGRQLRAPLNAGVFTVTSGYGHNTKLPFVEVHYEGKRAQMTAETARALAMNLLQAADSAESDGFVVEWFAERAGLRLDQAAGLLNEFRTWRERKRHEQQVHDHPPTEAA